MGDETAFCAHPSLHALHEVCEWCAFESGGRRSIAMQGDQLQLPARASQSRAVLQSKHHQEQEWVVQQEQRGTECEKG